jgi:hypothetical protein
MATIIHTCSSILVRPNGIVRYINAVLDLQKKLGHKTIFVTDAKPTQTINADTVIYLNEVSTYVPNMRDGHVWLQPDVDIINQIHQLYQQYNLMADLVVAHDLHSYYAASDNYQDGIFVQHESDVAHPGRYSFIDDEYLTLQKKVVANTNWRVGLVWRDPKFRAKRAIYTPPPFEMDTRPAPEKTRGLLYIGDATERKGAREFMEMARLCGETPTVITHEPDSELFAGADVYSFGLSDRKKMLNLMRQHRVAYIPSKNECMSLAVLECLQYMPVVLDGQYAWTHFHKDAGALVRDGVMIHRTIANHLVHDIEYDQTLIKSYSGNSLQYWRNLSTI